MALDSLKIFIGSDLGRGIIGFLTFITLIVYATYTAKIANKDYVPLISMAIKPKKIDKLEDKTDLQLYLRNHSKVEIEVFGKIKAKEMVSEKLFEFKTGFYGDKHPLILAPLQKSKWHFDLKDLEDEKGKKLEKDLKSKKIDNLRFFLHLKYRRFKQKKLLRLYEKFRKKKRKIKCGRSQKWGWKKYHDFKWAWYLDPFRFWQDDSP